MKEKYMNNKFEEEITIVKYEDKYKDKIIEFLIEVAIGEFGYRLSSRRRLSACAAG